MVKKSLIIKLCLIPIILGSAFCIWYFYFNKSDKALIKAHMNKLCELASKYPGEKITGGLIKSKALGNLFDEVCKLDIRAEMFSGSYKPHEITANSMRYRSFFKHAMINVHDLKIEILSPTEAQAEFTGSFDGETKSGKRVNEYQELSCKFKKIKGKWLIYQISMRRILEK